ncbi:MAG: UDP-N-acetylmuramate dehydrogenase [Candidatus Melainabacteria bacterium]
MTPVVNMPEKQTHLTGAEFTTYRVGGPLQAAYLPVSQEEALAVLTTARQAGEAVTMLGWGGNTIVASAGVSGMTMITRRMTRCTRRGDRSFEYEAGAHTAKIAADALKLGLHGAEYLIGIPGTVGGIVTMNAGAMGQETRGVVRSATVYDQVSGQLETWDAARLNFSYRHSDIDPARHVVLSAVFEFTPGDPVAMKQRMDDNVAFRKTHHPVEPNGGSVFKNPHPDHPAGRLLEALGAKEWREGGVRVSPRHANFIINDRHGTSTDILKLMTRMKAAVQQAHGYHLHPENKLLGDITPEENTLWQALQS